MKTLLLISLSFFCISLNQAQTKLFKAIEKNDLKKVQVLITDYEYYDIDNTYSAYNDDDSLEFFDLSTLEVAVNNESWEVFDWLIADKSKISNWTGAISKAFLSSISNENVAKSKDIYKMGADLSVACNHCHDQDALQIALVYELYDLAHFLINEGSPLDNINNHGSNLIHTIARNKKTDSKLTQLFIDKGLSVSIKNNLDLDALDYAALNDNLEIFNLLQKNGALINLDKGRYQTKLMNAATGGNVDIIEQVIDAGADINQIDKDSWNALNYAIEYQNFDAIKRLVENGAEINNGIEYTVHKKRTYTEGGFTTLIQVVEVVEKPEILKYLIENGLLDDETHYGKQKTLASYAKKRDCSKELIELYKTVPLMNKD